MRVTNGNARFRLIPQVMLLFALGILVTGIITCFAQRSLSDSAIQEQVETLANKVAKEAAASIHEYGEGRITVVERANETRIRVFETSDIHGYLLDTSGGNESLFQYRLADIAQIVNDDRTSGAYDDVQLSGKETARQIVNGFIEKNYGDQMSGLTYTYLNHGTEAEPDIEIVSITLSDGTEVDVHDEITTYRVCTCDDCATLEGSVFLGKTPVVPEAEAPIDNQAILALVRAEAAANNGLISVDVGTRGICLNESDPAAAA